MTGLPPLASRALALALLVALVALGWIGLVQPVIAKRHDVRAQIEQTRELLQRYRGITAGREELEAELAHWQREVLPKSGMLPGDNPAIVAAELQSGVSNVIKASDGNLLSIQILPGASEGKLRRVTVRVQFTANIEALTNILHELESARPYLFVENLQIRAGGRGIRSLASRLRRTSPQRIETLFVTGDVNGYMRGEVS
jgi:general secretion pathway protein M